jgi:hypothetical protein
MSSFVIQPRALTAIVAKACARCTKLAGAVVVGLLVLQTAALPSPAIAAWLPAAQRESEGEAPEESSKATDPEALVSTSSARARRAQADRLARLDHPVTRIDRARTVAQFRPAESAEFSGRNGQGCALRC